MVERLKISANLGFLWTALPLPERVEAAARAGFDAVELHFPYDTPPAELRRALGETRLPIVSLNTRPGDMIAGEFGLAALPGREAEARAAIDEALDYAAAVGCPMVHVMAGKAAGVPGADETYRANLRYAARRAAARGHRILIEPINRGDVPGYFLDRLEHAAALVDTIGSDSLRIMFDCYHMQINGGDLLRRFAARRDRIGHVQFASVPDRTEPDGGEVNYAWLLREFRAAGYAGAFGAEYRPTRSGEPGFGWLASLQGG